MTSLPSSRSGRSAVEIATGIARGAGILLLNHLHTEKRLDVKEGRANVVTNVDMLSEMSILDALHNEYPGCRILSEESGSTGVDSPYTWIVDPIDGTNNYIFGVPIFSIAIALMCDMDILLGLIYDPIRGELFVAQKGNGAFLNDRPISVSDRTCIKNCLIGYDMGYKPEVGEAVFGLTKSLWPDIHGFRIVGSAALGLAYVASGRFDLYFHPILYPWDCAGGILLVNEAGGCVTDWGGKPATINSQQLIASNGTIHSEFLKQASKYPVNLE